MHTITDTAFIDRLKELARGEVVIEHEDYEDLGIEEWAGDDVAQAHEIGLNDGETMLARQCLIALGVDF